MTNAHEGPASAEQLDALRQLPDAFVRALSSMYASEPQVGHGAARHPIDDTTRVSVDEGLALVDLVVAGGVDATLEVGLAYGFSAAFLLAGLTLGGAGRHTAVDPYQASDWHGIGATTAGALIRAGRPAEVGFELIEERSEAALVDLARAGRSFGLVFIDGYHRFDDVLVDFTLAAHLVPLGGVLVLHDMWLGSIAAVASFLLANRNDFVEVDTRCANLFAVRRVGEDRRNWDHFAPFAT